jgi:uncharacterized protein YkvS
MFNYITFDELLDLCGGDICYDMEIWKASNDEVIVYVIENEYILETNKPINELESIAVEGMAWLFEKDHPLCQFIGFDLENGYVLITQDDFEDLETEPLVVIRHKDYYNFISYYGTITDKKLYDYTDYFNVKYIDVDELVDDIYSNILKLTIYTYDDGTLGWILHISYLFDINDSDVDDIIYEAIFSHIHNILQFKKALVMHEEDVKQASKFVIYTLRGNGSSVEYELNDFYKKLCNISSFFKDYGFKFEDIKYRLLAFAYQVFHNGSVEQAFDKAFFNIRRDA